MIYLFGIFCIICFPFVVFFNWERWWLKWQISSTVLTWSILHDITIIATLARACQSLILHTLSASFILISPQKSPMGRCCWFSNDWWEKMIREVSSRARHAEGAGVQDTPSSPWLSYPHHCVVFIFPYYLPPKQSFTGLLLVRTKSWSLLFLLNISKAFPQVSKFKCLCTVALEACLDFIKCLAGNGLGSEHWMWGDHGSLLRTERVGV